MARSGHNAGCVTTGAASQHSEGPGMVAEANSAKAMEGREAFGHQLFLVAEENIPSHTCDEMAHTSEAYRNRIRDRWSINS